MPDEKAKKAKAKSDAQRAQQQVHNAKQRANANLEGGFQSLLVGWQIPITPDVKAFIAHAVQAKMSSTAFLQAFRHTRAYAKRFPGIMRGNGTLRMTEAQYISGYNSAKDFAASVGRGLSQDAYGMAIKNNNSPAEIRVKIEALDNLRSNQALMHEFSDYLVARNIINKPLKKQDMLAFIMKQAPPAWEKEWNTAFTAARLQEAGFEVGRGAGNDIHYKTLTKAVQHFESLGGDLDQVDFAGLAATATQALPASRLYGLGITKKDLVMMALGTKKAPAIAARVQQAINTAQAFATEQRANPELTAGGMRGTAGIERVQSTE